VNTSNRRTFKLQVVASSAALATSKAMAQAAGPKVSETDPHAAGLS
jgi:hypothetical protein